ncbi:MAG: hypothetical protein NVV60_01425 [Luteimonas sp.]|nr:hypothetical protein [Luteimonas sp.]
MLKLKKTNTVARKVKVRLPTENPNSFNEGEILVRFKISTKDEIAERADRELSDREYIGEIVDSVEGLGDEDGNPIAGDAAMHEVYAGVWSAYLQSAIFQEYHEQYGVARVKNSKTSRGR